MMTASHSIDATPSIPSTANIATPHTHTLDALPVVSVSSSVNRLYHTIRTASPPSTSTPQQEAVATERILHFDMQKRCVDPPGRNSDDEASEDGDDDDDSLENADDPSYDWSSISSMDEQDDDLTMAEAPEAAASPVSTQRRHVTFGMMEIYEVPALSDYTMEDNTSFWYTSMDMISTRREGRLATMSDASVKNYLYHYEFLYRKLQTNNETYRDSSELALSELDVKILAYGLRGGYQGLERESKFEQVRQQERHTIVKTIVDLHKTMKVDGATTIDRNSNTSNTSNSSHVRDKDEAFRAYASSLTNTMSQWAASLGQAAHLAIDAD